MTNYQRITAKVFGETATATGNDPEIGQFGSALAGTYAGTTDVNTIQNLTAWSNGFIDCVTPSQQFPPLPEMTGFGKVISYQEAYLLQKGIPEWDSGTTYYYGDLCKATNSDNKICIYKSKVDNNSNNAVTNTTYWLEIPIEDIQTLGDWCVTEPTTISTATLNKPAVVKENYLNGGDWYRVYSDGWCEQGGILAQGSGSYTVNFLKPFKDTNYSIFKHFGSNSGAYSLYYYFGFYTKTSSSATTTLGGSNTSCWYACGFVS